MATLDNFFVRQYKFFSLVNTYAKFKLKSESSKTYLSYFWWLLEPALFVAAFYFVFAVVMKSGKDDFIVFLMIGKIPFLWFSKSISGACSRIIESKPLLTNSSLRLELLPLVDLWQNSYKSLVVMSFLMVFVITMGLSISINWLFILFVLFAQFMLMLPMVLFFAWITAFLPDFKMLTSLFVMLVMFLSGIFWDVNTLDPSLREMILTWNPFAFIFSEMRTVLMQGKVPNLSHLTAIVVASTFATAFMFGFFQITRSMLTKRVLHS